MCWCFIACGLNPSQSCTPPLAYFVVIVVSEWWLWLSGCQPERVSSDAQSGGQHAPPWPDAPTLLPLPSKTAAVALCMFELEPNMSVWLNGSEGFQIKICQLGQQYLHRGCKLTVVTHRSKKTKQNFNHLLPLDCVLYTIWYTLFALFCDISWDPNFMLTYHTYAHIFNKFKVQWILSPPDHL